MDRARWKEVWREPEDRVARTGLSWNEVWREPEDRVARERMDRAELE